LDREQLSGTELIAILNGTDEPVFAGEPL
jgi:hypothetical protein